MTAQLLVLDNYDSFTFNLVQVLGALGAGVRVLRSDEVRVDELLDRPPAAIVLSPGPGTPERAGNCISVIKELSGKVPILGVCLGHQAIGAAFGGRVVRAPQVVHGKTSAVHHDASRLFEGVPSPFHATRYHSLVIDAACVPSSLRVTARSDDGVLMAVEHRSHPTFGVQFHPESIMTKHGKRLLANFLEIAGLEPASRRSKK